VNGRIVIATVVAAVLGVAMMLRPGAPSGDVQDFAGTWDAVIDPMIRHDTAAAVIASTAASVETTGNEVLDARVAKARSARSAADDATDAARGSDGAPVQRNTILVLFRKNTPDADISALLQQLELFRRARLGSVPLYVVESPARKVLAGEAEAARLRTLVETLKGQPIVATAVQNTYLGINVLPKPNAANPKNPCWDWNDPNCPSTQPLQRMFFPEAWNFRNAIAGRTQVGIVDHGFDFRQSHEDVTYTLAPGCIPRTFSHGNQVAGIIAAGFGNATGIDGASPVADLIVCAPKTSDPPPATSTDPEERNLQIHVNSFSSIVDGLSILLDQGVPVINMSMGYNWFLRRQRPVDSKVIQTLVAGQGTIVRALLKNRRSIIVSAAGNDCVVEPQPCPLETKWTSPVNWAALDTSGGTSDPPADNVIVVEATDLAGKRLPLSNAGMIGAVGAGVVSTFSAPSVYGICFDGTSFATPFVTATVSMMLAYNPGLNAAEIKKNLGITGSTVTFLNAFQALAASNPRAAADLANLDSKAGIDMRDFTLFKSAFHQVTTGTFVDDLNEDGNGTPDANDFRFCRADLNGDGEISATRKSFVPNLGNVTDLEVMMRAWTDPTVDRRTLPALLLQ
jgi:hypothetical protein